MSMVLGVSGSRREQNTLSRFSGDYSGRKKLDSGLFGMGEYFMIPTPDCKNFQYFCFADHIKE